MKKIRKLKALINCSFFEGNAFKKNLRMVRFTLFCFFLSLFHVMAVDSYSQATRLSLNVNNVRLEHALERIENESEFFFLYNKDLIDVEQKVKIEVENETINSILDNLFSGKDINYEVHERQIVLSNKNEYLRSKSMQGPVSGVVTNESGQSIPGVTVVVKGTTTGTVTDIDGNYFLSKVPANASLIFSFVGMKTNEVVVSGQTTINIVLVAESIGLDEVVAIGYGVSKKSDLTGSVSTISTADIARQPVIRIEDALKGKAAGVQVQKPNGAPGSGMKIRIRGANSINGGNDPLYVIDGYIGADIISLNPNEIKSINILKDASSTAIYGSRGANGVVIITTKTAKSGDSKIEFDAFYSVDQISNTYDLLDGVQYMETVNARHEAIGIATQFTNAEIDAIRNSGGTDWQDEVFRSGATQNYQLSFTGGTEKSQYYLSGTVVDQKGIILNSNYKRYGLRTNINSKLRDNFDLAFTMYSSYEESRNNGTLNGRGGASGSALVFSPNIPVWDNETNDYTISPSYGPIASNPVYTAERRIFDNKKFQTLANVSFNYKITDALTLSVGGGAKGYFYDNPYLKTASPGTPISNTEAGHNNGYGWNLQNTNSLNYNKIFAEKHHLNLTAVYEQQLNISRSNGAWATGFPTIALGYDNLSLGDTKRVSSGYQNWSIQSFLGRLNYTFNDRYLFTATFRADGSSKFYGDNKYGYFPSGAFAWRMSDEPFIKKLNVFQNLKMRSSYGVTGSQAIGPYKTLSLLSLGQNFSYNGSTNQATGIGPGIAANPDLKWETTAQTNIGIDFGLFNGRLSGTMDYYYKKTTDLLLNISVPDYSGGGNITKNVGSLENKGFEFLLSGVIIDNSTLKLNTSFNISVNKNKILDLGAETEIFTDGGYSGSSYSAPPFILKVGQPLGQFRGLKFDGLWQVNEATAAAEYGLVPGDTKYVDVDNNKSYGGEDMMNIGSAQPDFIWGWNTTLEYKNFDLSVYVNGVQGNDVWNQTKWLTIGMGTDVENPTSVDILNRWTPSNTNTTVAGFSATNTTYAQSSQFVEDGSFIRLNNVTLGYTFPKSFLNNRLKDARIYASGQNLLVITNYSGIDPELSSTPNYSDVAQGIDNGTYPATRTITFGVKVAF